MNNFKSDYDGDNYIFFQNEAKQFYDTLTEDQKLKVFCHIIKNLYEAEVVNKSTYRGLLYDKFKFKTQAYNHAFDSGMLELHNLISTAVHIQDRLKDLFNYLGIDMDNEEFNRVSHRFLYGFKEYSIKENTKN